MIATVQTILLKAKKGSTKAGHKYTSRKPDGKGGWIYEYGHGAAQQHAMSFDAPAQPAKARLRLAEANKFTELLVDGLALDHPNKASHGMTTMIKQSVCSAITNRMQRAGYLASAVKEWGEWYDVPESDTDAESLLTFVQSSVHQWAESSGDHSVMSVALQLAAVEEFDLDAHTTEHFDSNTLRKAQKTPPAVRQLQRQFLRAQYNETQMLLRMHGLTHVTMYRGIFNPTGAVPKVDQDWQHGEVQLQPVSSFSADLDTANFFAMENGVPETGKHKNPAWLGVVMGVRVPAERVLSTARSGFGCFREHEATILGGTYPAFFTDARMVVDDMDEFYRMASEAGVLDHFA